MIAAAFAFLRASWLGRMVAYAAGIAILAFGIWQAGRASQRQDKRVDDLEGALDVHKRADEAKVDAARRAGQLSDDDLRRELQDLGAWRDG